jgi:hypothetical protein
MLFTINAALAVFMLQASATPPETQKSDAPTVEATNSDTVEIPSPTLTATTTAAAPITDKTHPDYVRCRSERVIGSLAKRTKTCMTNREWEVASRVGNQGARDIVQSQQVGMNGQ